MNEKLAVEYIQLIQESMCSGLTRVFLEVVVVLKLVIVRVFEGNTFEASSIVGWPVGRKRVGHISVQKAMR